LTQMSSVKRPQLKFLLVLFETLMCLRGKANYRNLSRYSSLCEKTYARWSSQHFDFIEFNKLGLAPWLTEARVWVAALDCSFVEKGGKQTHGLGMFYNGKHSKAEKGLEMSTLALVDVEYNTAYNLSTHQTSAKPEEGQPRIDQYLDWVRQDREALPSFVRYLVADGYYSKTNFVNGIPDMGLQLISKLRQDAKLRWLYTGEQKPLGRKRQYDGRVRFDELQRFDFVAETDDVKRYTATVNCPAFKRDIRIVYLLKKAGNTVQTALLFSTNLDLAAQAIYRYYKARFQIEFLCRDAKQFTGLCDCQSCRKDAQHFHFNATMSALNLIKFEDRLQAPDGKRKVISIASWKIRKANAHLFEHFFCSLGLDFNAIKSSLEFEQLCRYGTIAA